MRVAELTKEQKQYIILGIIVAISVIVLSVFGVKMSLSSIAVARAELDEVSEKIEEAERTLKDREEVGNEFAETILQLKQNIAMAAPGKNYYSWATEILYSHARMSGLEIDAVDELDLSGRRGKAAEEVALESYSLRISAQGSYTNITHFLQSLEESQPLLRITGVDIRTGKNPEMHIAQIFVQWPANMGVLETMWKEIGSQKAILRQQEQAARRRSDESGDEAEVVSVSKESVTPSSGVTQI